MFCHLKLVKLLLCGFYAAVALGLVDKLGGLDTAIDLMKEILNIPEEDDVQLLTYPRPGTPLDLILQQFRDTFIYTGLPEEIQELREQLAMLGELQQEYRFAWWPCRIVTE